VAFSDALFPPLAAALLATSNYALTFPEPASGVYSDAANWTASAAGIPMPFIDGAGVLLLSGGSNSIRSYSFQLDGSPLSSLGAGPSGDGLDVGMSIALFAEILPFGPLANQPSLLSCGAATAGGVPARPWYCNNNSKRTVTTLFVNLTFAHSFYPYFCDLFFPSLSAIIFICKQLQAVIWNFLGRMQTTVSFVLASPPFRFRLEAGSITR
jgi:hypothetical protein